MSRKAFEAIYDDRGQKSKRNDIMNQFKARQSMISTPNTKTDNKIVNRRFPKNNSIEEFGKLAKKAAILNKNAPIQINNPKNKQNKQNMQEIRSMFFSPKLSQCRSANFMLFEDNFKNIVNNGKGDSFAQSQKKKSKGINDCSKLSANLSKGWEGFRILDESKKKSKNLHSNTMKVSFSNKSLAQKVKKNWKDGEAPKLKKFDSLS